MLVAPVGTGGQYIMLDQLCRKYPSGWYRVLQGLAGIKMVAEMTKEPPPAGGYDMSWTDAPDLVAGKYSLVDVLEAHAAKPRTLQQREMMTAFEKWCQKEAL